MKAYKVLHQLTQTETYFNKISKMCDKYGWDAQNMRNRKHKTGMPLVKNDGDSFYIISEIEIL